MFSCKYRPCLQPPWGCANPVQRCERQRHAESRPRPQGFKWHGDKHIEELAPSHPQSTEWVERQQEILPHSNAGRLLERER